MGRALLILGLLIAAVPAFSGGAAGYDGSAGTVSADINASYNRAYDASLEGIRAMGGLSIDKKTEGWVKSKLDDYSVAVHIEKLTATTTRITVSAEQFDVPKPQYARDVLEQILKRQKQQPFWMR